MQHSIVIPTHNRPMLLRRAVASALASQTGTAEVIVVDDHSREPAATVLGQIGDSRLKVVPNEGARGAASARNFGVTVTSGEVVFFLDDDDEMTPDYCGRILAGPSAAAAWGFSSIRLRRVRPDGSFTDTDETKGRWSGSGLVPDTAPLRTKIGATSAGFWIRRDLFQTLGGFDPRQVVDEDTDLCCRLVMSGHPPWYEAKPGTIVYRDYQVEAGHEPQLTSATKAAAVAASYLRTYEKAEPQLPPLSEARWFLATRYIRRSVKLGLSPEARAFCRDRKPLVFRWALGAYLMVKQLSLRLKANKA